MRRLDFLDFRNILFVRTNIYLREKGTSTSNQSSTLARSYIRSFSLRTKKNRRAVSLSIYIYLYRERERRAWKH